MCGLRCGERSPRKAPASDKMERQGGFLAVTRCQAFHGLSGLCVRQLLTSVHLLFRDMLLIPSVVVQNCSLGFSLCKTGLGRDVCERVLRTEFTKLWVTIFRSKFSRVYGGAHWWCTFVC